jgi:excisionase family DNA binding protein
LSEFALTALGELVRKKKLFNSERPKTILGEGGSMTEREEELLNSRQVAVILDLSPDTVNEFARKNILPAFKKGKQWRFRKRDISIFYKKQSRDIRDA